MSTPQVISIYQQIISKTDIAKVIGHFLPSLKQQGSNYVAMCPFHHDKNPSLTVNVQKGIYKCFACPQTADVTTNKSGGNVIKFVKNYLNISYHQAACEVAKIIGFKMPMTYAPSYEYSPEQKAVFRANFIAKNYFLDSLQLALDKSTLSNELLAIINQIGYKQIKKFQVGFANKQTKNFLLDQVKKEVISQASLNDSKLINNDQDNHAYSFFYNRLMFPIYNEGKKIVGFTGRSLQNQAAKYLNSQDSKYFNKNNCLYNIHNLTNLNSKSGIYIVEGPKDVIAMDLLGWSNTVSILGANLSTTQIKILQKYSSHLIFVPDQDEAGYNSAITNAFKAISSNCTVKIVSRLPHKDVADCLISEKITTIKAAINNQLDYFDFVLKFYSQNLNLNEHQSVINFINNVLDKIIVYYQKPVVISALLQQVSNYSKIEVDVIKITYEEKVASYIKQIALLEQKQQQLNSQSDKSYDQSSNISFDKYNLAHLLILQILYHKQAINLMRDYQTKFNITLFENNLIWQKIIKVIQNFYAKMQINQENCQSIINDKHALGLFENELEQLIEKKHDQQEQFQLIKTWILAIVNHQQDLCIYQSYNEKYCQKILDNLVAQYFMVAIKKQRQLIKQLKTSLEKQTSREVQQLEIKKIENKIQQLRRKINQTSWRNKIGLFI